MLVSITYRKEPVVPKAEKERLFIFVVTEEETRVKKNKSSDRYGIVHYLKKISSR